MDGYFKRKNIQVEYLANNLLIYLFLKYKKKNVFIVKKETGKVSSKEKDWHENFSVITGRLSKSEAKDVYDSVKENLKTRSLKKMWNIIIIPSGRLINHIALKDFAIENKIKCLFVGYGNIPGRTFVDPKGTDKDSALYENIEILDELSVNKETYEVWRESYIKQKMLSHKIGQARQLTFGFKVKKLVQIFSCYIERLLTLAVENSYHWKDFKNFFREKPSFFYDEILPEKFVFFPMQVSTDAQIVLNYSKKNVLAGLIDAHAKAEKKGYALVVNLHPAEIDQKIIEDLLRLKIDLGFYLSCENTFKLIEKSQEVVVINSTVGLESKILRKPVTFLGETMYKHFTEKQCASYVMKYLLHIDYFEKDVIADTTVKEFLSRSSI